MKVIMVCTKKFFSWQMVILGPKMAHLHKSGSARIIFLKFCIMKGANRYMEILLVVFEKKNSFGANWARPLFIGSLNSQDMIRILKQWRHDFSGKHLCIRYCMDIMWCLCGGQNSWFCKVFLRICYVSLSECKGHWMLKNVINCNVWNRRLQN